MAKFKFDLSLMGKEVIVTHILERKVEGDNRFWESKEVEEKRVGWIIGHSWCCNGTYNAGYSSVTYWGDEDDSQPAYLEVTEKIPCLLVTYWPNQKPIKIPINGFVIWNEDDIGHSLLKPYSSSGYGSGKYREEMLANYRNFINEYVGRDKKGR
jgi:hypothetical protein